MEIPIVVSMYVVLGSESLSCVWFFVTPWTVQSKELNSPGQNTGVVSRSLLQGIVPTQGSNSGSHAPALQVGSLPAEP